MSKDFIDDVPIPEEISKWIYHNMPDACKEFLGGDQIGFQEGAEAMYRMMNSRLFAAQQTANMEISHRNSIIENLKLNISYFIDD